VRLPRFRGEPNEFDRTWQPRLWGVLIGLVLILAYVIGFIIQNDSPVDVDFIFGTANASLIWVILLSLAIGLVAGLLLSQLYRRRGALSDRSQEPG
jgi:uncharacterized integral membrane protein